MLITPERKVPQGSDASQNDQKSKGYPSKTSEAAFTIQKADKGHLRRLARPPLKLTFKNPTFQLYSIQVKIQSGPLLRGFNAVVKLKQPTRA